MRGMLFGPKPFSAALCTDLYELTMLQAYWRESMLEEAVFSLFTRELPPERNYLLACGLEQALSYLESIAFSQDELDYLSGLGLFLPGFLEWLADFRFEGDVWAVPEGTPVFAGEPVLEVAASLPQGQIGETCLMNLVHFQTLAASKAARVVTAAAGRAVVDFGFRRMHGLDTGVAAARAFHVAGASASSNVLAGYLLGTRVSGTMAHSYVQAHDNEYAAFREFSSLYPETILLVDTYDTLEGVREVIRLSREQGAAFQVYGVRLDSGDLGALARASRDMLDAAGLARVSIFASGSLDEYAIARLVADGAPIDGFGVGTRLGVSSDAPYLDMVYKLVSYAGEGRLKTSPAKMTLPGRKQVFRQGVAGRAKRDILAGADEHHPGEALLVKVMENGRRLPEAASATDPDAARERAAAGIAALPEAVQGLDPADPPYVVETSAALLARRDRLVRDISRQRHETV